MSKIHLGLNITQLRNPTKRGLSFMSNSSFKIGKLTGKGAAAVTCLCLAAVAAVGVYTYSRSDRASQENISAAEGAADPPEAEVQNAEAVQNNIPILPAEDLLPGEEPAEDVDSSGIEANEADENDAVNPPPAETEAPFENGEALAEGIIVRPLDGEIIEPFSDGELVKSTTLGVWKTHDGIDIAGEPGEHIRAAAEGVVTAVYTDPLWGNCIVIEHTGGYESCYYGVSDTVYVSESDAVSAGTEIGEVGNTADGESAEDTHLHFGLKENGKWVDPAAALSGYGS